MRFYGPPNVKMDPLPQEHIKNFFIRKENVNAHKLILINVINETTFSSNFVSCFSKR